MQPLGGGRLSTILIKISSVFPRQRQRPFSRVISFINDEKRAPRRVNGQRARHNEPSIHGYKINILLSSGGWAKGGGVATRSQGASQTAQPSGTCQNRLTTKNAWCSWGHPVYAMPLTRPLAQLTVWNFSHFRLHAPEPSCERIIYCFILASISNYSRSHGVNRLVGSFPCSPRLSRGQTRDIQISSPKCSIHIQRISPSSPDYRAMWIYGFWENVSSVGPEATSLPRRRDTPVGGSSPQMAFRQGLMSHGFGRENVTDRA